MISTTEKSSVGKITAPEKLIEIISHSNTWNGEWCNKGSLKEWGRSIESSGILIQPEGSLAQSSLYRVSVPEQLMILIARSQGWNVKRVKRARDPAKKDDKKTPELKSSAKMKNNWGIL